MGGMEINGMAGFTQKHGALSVTGGRLVDTHGEPLQLIGVSTHGISWYPQYVCRETFTSLRDDFGMNCFRIALYTHEYAGYCTGGNKRELKDIVLKGAELADELGLYAIIDWHVLNDKDPLLYAEQSEEFFGEISSKLSGKTNILYEICNEPNSGADWDCVTAYSERIIPIIRANAPKSVILVGSPTWSQDIFCPAERPLPYDNIMYTLHFYAATHGENLRKLTERCVKGGLPVFVSEFGLCDSSGGGSIDEVQAREWLTLLDEYGISRICWNLSDNPEAAALIKHGCKKLGGWTDDELTPHGKMNLLHHI